MEPREEFEASVKHLTRRRFLAMLEPPPLGLSSPFGSICCWTCKRRPPFRIASVSWSVRPHLSHAAAICARI